MKPPKGTHTDARTRLGLNVPGRKLGGRVGADAAPISTAGGTGSGRKAK
jgi:hypothetical protein